MGIRIGSLSRRQFEKVCASGDTESLNANKKDIISELRSSTGTYVSDILLRYTVSNVWLLNLRKEQKTDIRSIFQRHWIACEQDRLPLLQSISAEHANMSPVELLHWLWTYPRNSVETPLSNSYTIYFDYDDIREKESSIANAFSSGKDRIVHYHNILQQGWALKQPVLSTMLRYMSI